MQPRSTTASLLLATACAVQPAPSQPPSPLLSASASMVTVPSDSGAKSHVVAPLTVALVVDQLASWVARDRLEQLPATGGFARLRKEGTWYQDVRFAHAITDTAPGHASLYTGKVPREHGIVANELWIGGHIVAIVADDTTRAVTAEGERPEFSSSARAIGSEVVADRFKSQYPLSKVYALSLKDRGALFAGGRHADLSLWYDAKLGQFLSSTAFTHKLPDWVVPSIGQEAIKSRLAQIWMPLQPIAGYPGPYTTDDQPGEGNYALYGAKFPHQPSHSSQPFAMFRANPESDKMLLELALLAIENSPSDSPTLLAISLSANDYIGHLFGPDSWEAKDELLRLDTSLGWFFGELDRRRGPEHWNAVLSADHGIMPLPEVSRVEAKRFHEAGTQGSRPRELTERILPAIIEKAAHTAAKKAAGKGNWIAAFVDPYLYLSDDARRLSQDKNVKLRAAVTEALARIPGVAQLFDTTLSPANCPGLDDDSLDALVCRSIQPGRGGDYYVALKPGYFFDTGYAPGFGTSHGNAELSDRSVPLLARAPGKVEPGKTESQPQSFELFARELETLLNLR